MNIRHFSFNPYQTNCFVAWEEEGTCIVVDPSFRSGAESDRFMAALEQLGTRPAASGTGNFQRKREEWNDEDY